MTKNEFLIKKMHELVRTAYGCTEIGAIAYPCAVAYSYANNEQIEKLTIEISSYIYKNVSRVGVPNLGFCGVSMIAAAGAMVADPKRKLEMFSTVTPEQKEKAHELIIEGRVKVEVPYNCDPVWAKATIITVNGNKYEAAVKGVHDNLIFAKKNGEFLFRNEKETPNKKKAIKEEYTAWDYHLADLVNLASSLKEEDLTFLEDVFKVNVELSEYGKKHIIPGSFTDIYKRVYGNDMNITQRIIFDTAAAVDARMAGAALPVMSSCGSGDHGLTLSIPQYTFHKMLKTSNIRFLRGLALANLVTWKVKTALGELSAFCGSILASCTASLVGIAYQSNFTNEQLRSLINSCMSSYAMALCDGAKMSCTFKIAAGLSQGVMLYFMARYGFRVKPKDGIIGDTPSQTLRIFKGISDKHSKDINATLVKGLNEINKEK